MDQTQNDHLKAYGLIYSSLKKQIQIEWLLNYKNGSFLLDNNNIIEKEALIRGITFYNVNSSEINTIYETINN